MWPIPTPNRSAMRWFYEQKVECWNSRIDQKFILKLCSTGGFLCIIKILVLLLKYCIKNFSNLGYIFVKGKINFELLLYYGLRNSEMFFKVRDKCYRWKEVGIYWRPVWRHKGRIKSRTRPRSLRQDKLAIRQRHSHLEKNTCNHFKRKFLDSFAAQPAERGDCVRFLWSSGLKLRPSCRHGWIFFQILILKSPI